MCNFILKLLRFQLQLVVVISYLWQIIDFKFFVLLDNMNAIA